MVRAVTNASAQEQLNLIRSHPDLAGKAALAGDVTRESWTEQGNAGLNSLTREELTTFTQMNDAYKERFGFPFILAVRNASKRTILASFERRLQNSRPTEIHQALQQIHKIAWMRLLGIVGHAHTGFLTCHVLDTASGSPASRMHVELYRVIPGRSSVSGMDERELIDSFVTNDDGRLDSPALQGEAFSPGVYEWIFHVGDYFARGGVHTDGQPFLDVVPLRFGIDNPELHYHVPLLCSPWSYSTYRGS